MADHGLRIFGIQPDVRIVSCVLMVVGIPMVRVMVTRMLMIIFLQGAALSDRQPLQARGHDEAHNLHRAR